MPKRPCLKRKDWTFTSVVVEAETDNQPTENVDESPIARPVRSTRNQNPSYT